MHRLLMHKGYRFHRVPRAAPTASSSVTSVAENLKSAAELEAKDRRRRVDYHTQALSELERLESKIILLGEMLDNANMAGGERSVTGDVYEQVAAILTTSRPKIQKWISGAEASEDTESLGALQFRICFVQSSPRQTPCFSSTTRIHTVLPGRYEAFCRGDYEAAANPVPSQYAAPTLLIDFDDPTPASSAPSSTANDLDALFGGLGGGIAVSSPHPTKPRQPPSGASVITTTAATNKHPTWWADHAAIHSLPIWADAAGGGGGGGVAPP
ncbi:hypothetical protein DFH07DRAFT_1035974 [Mycena maculata]|uniref:Uncharacterized protein n=1 Tax=Mycena maculata TaxID=230809 RepID=A0AAD7K6H2_9AGAR|nr:hypothetical protein DFH07DRAFT_1035974 [Mycena maculata]